MGAPEILRLPPHSIEAEQSLVGGLLLDNTAWDRITGLVDESDFYRDDHRRIFNHIGKLVEAGKPADVITVYESIEKSNETNQTGGLAYLSEIANATPSAANIRRYAEAVHERAVLRKLVAVGDEIAANALNPAGRSVDELIAFAQKRVDEAQDPGAIGSQQPGGMQESLRLFIDALEQTENGEGVSTGLLDLDAKLGKLQAGDVVVVAGRTGMGKTVAAVSISRLNAMAGKRVLFFSQEMTTAQLVGRILASETAGQIPPNAARHGLPEELLGLATEAMARIQDWPLIIDDRRLTPAQMASVIRRATAKKQKPDLVIIDYLQYVPADRPVDNRTVEVGQISMAIKELAKRAGVPVIVLAQLNREAEGKDARPSISNLRESGAIEQDADAIVLLYREAYYDKEIRDDDPRQRIVEAIIGKNRHGPVGTVNLYWNGAASLIGNLEDDWRQAGKDAGINLRKGTNPSPITGETDEEIFG